MGPGWAPPHAVAGGRLYCADDGSGARHHAVLGKPVGAVHLMRFDEGRGAWMQLRDLGLPPGALRQPLLLAAAGGRLYVIDLRRRVAVVSVEEVDRVGGGGGGAVVPRLIEGDGAPEDVVVTSVVVEHH